MKFLKQLFPDFIFFQQKLSFSKEDAGGSGPAEPIDQTVIDDFNPKLTSATRIHRFLNLVIDIIAFFIIINLTFIIFPELGPESSGVIKLDGDQIQWWRYLVLPASIQILITMILYVVFEYLFGQTPGKMATNTKVVDSYGKKPGFGTIALRTLLRLIPFEAFSFFGPINKGLHDTLSKTRVVIIKKFAINKNAHIQKNLS